MGRMAMTVRKADGFLVEFPVRRPSCGTWIAEAAGHGCAPMWEAAARVRADADDPDRSGPGRSRRRR